MIQAKCACGGGCPSCQDKLKRVQTKLEVSTPGDMYEREADAVAERVLEMDEPQVRTARPTITPLVQRAEAKPEDEDKLKAGVVQRSQPGRAPPQSRAPPSPADLTQGGEPLPGPLRSFFEPRFGRDLSSVRVHRGADAGAQTSRMDAYAFAYDNHVWLGAGVPLARNFVLAHELAHVVQQHQPPPITSGVPAPEASSAPKGVQRFTPFWFWTPVGWDGNRIHDAMLNDFARPTDFDVEIGIPNANRDGGTGFDANRGKADWYKSTPAPAIGVRFESDPGGPPCGDRLRGRPGGLNTTIAGRQPRPSRSGVSGAARAPTDIVLGELKPAERDLISFGDDQITAYMDGILFANEQTNCWAGAGAWPTPALGRIDDSTLPVPSGYQFNPRAQFRNHQLVLGYFDKYENVSRFLSPVGRTGVEGGLYATHVRDGVVAYFARPADLPALLRSLGTTSFRAQAAQEATLVQNQVIAPLLTPPQPAPLRRSRVGMGQALAVSPDRSHTIRRKRKARKVKKLEDRFSLTAWQDAQTKATARFRKEKDQPTFQNLEFLEAVYKAEDQVQPVMPSTGADKLPPKSELEVEIKGSRAGPGRDKPRTKRMSMVDVFGFVELWTGPEVRFLGIAREKFGGTFVSVALAVGSLKQKLADKLEATRKMSDRGGSSYGALAIRAFWRAAMSILGVLFQDTLAVLVDSLVSGLKAKFEAIFDADVGRLRELVKTGFPELNAAVKLVEGLKTSIEEKIGSVLTDLQQFFDQLVTVADTARTLGHIIKAAMIAFQCGTPLGWGCFKLIASELIKKATNEILSWCSVQKEIAGFALSTGFFNSVPAVLAEKIANMGEGLLPASVVPVFDRSFFSTVKPLKPTDVPCQTGKELNLAVAALHDKLLKQLGEDGLLAFDIARMKYGIRDDRELTAEDVQDLIEQIPDISAEELWEYVGTTGPPDPTTAKKLNLAEFLQHVKTKAAEAAQGGGGGAGLTGPGGLPAVYAPSAKQPTEPGGALIPDLLFAVLVEPWHEPLKDLKEPKPISVTVIVSRGGKNLLAVLEVPVHVVDVTPGKGNSRKIHYKLLKKIYLGPEMDVTMVGKDGLLFGSTPQ